jgi:hypothetical protein
MITNTYAALSPEWPGLMYRVGQMSDGSTPMAFAMIPSALGYGLSSAFRRVVFARPFSRPSSAIDVPVFLIAATISAGCQSKELLLFFVITCDPFLLVVKLRLCVVADLF